MRSRDVAFWLCAALVASGLPVLARAEGAATEEKSKGENLTRVSLEINGRRRRSTFHADTPHQEVIFLDELDPTISTLKAKGVGELGISGVPAAIANAIYNATGIRVRQYPITLDKLLDSLPEVMS